MAIAPPNRSARKRWLKVPYNGKLEGVVMSEIYSSLIHWHGGQAKPCTGIACELCGLAVGIQTRYTFALWESGDVGLVELTESHYKELLSIEDMHGGSIVGAIVVLRRIRPAKNARILIHSMDKMRLNVWLKAEEIAMILAGNLTPLQRIPVHPFDAKPTQSPEQQRRATPGDSISIPHLSSIPISEFLPARNEP